MCDNPFLVDLIDLYLLPISVGVAVIILFTEPVQNAFDLNRTFKIIANLLIIFIIVYVLDRLIVRFRQSYVCRSFV